MGKKIENLLEQVEEKIELESEDSTIETIEENVDLVEDNGETASEEVVVEEVELEEPVIVESAALFDENITLELSEESKAHLDSIFKGEELSEEFSAKVKEIFEAAVIDTAKKVVLANQEKLTEAYNAKVANVLAVVEEETKLYEEELTAKTDKYFDHIVEEWYANNEENAKVRMKNELTESFISGLKNLFEEHYVEIPDDKEDLYESLVADLEASKEAQNKVLSENIDLKNTIKSIEKKHLIEESASDLAESDKEKFVSLAENLEFKNEESFKKNLSEIVERYFNDENIEVVSITEEETPILINEEKVVVKNRTEVDYIVDTMKQFSRFSK